MLSFMFENEVMSSRLNIFAMKYLCVFEIIASPQREHRCCVHGTRLQQKQQTQY